MHYRMRQKLLSVGDDYWIDDADGRHRYRVDGKVLPMRRTFHLEEPDGTRVAVIRSRPLSIKDSMSVEDPAGRRIALVKKALITPLRDRWRVEQQVGGHMTVHGDFIDHEFTFERNGRKVAEVSKKWFRI